MRLDQNTGIRFNIMLIAVLGGFGFLCYLLVNVHLANANKDRLNELLNHHYPVIEQIRRLKQDADSIRESLTAAVALEDGFMVEDSIELANRFRDSAGRLADMEPALKAEVQALMHSFERYYGNAQALALLLIESEDDLAALKQQLDATHLAFSEVLTQVDALYQSAQADYSALLLKTHSAVIDATRLGALLGLLVIAGLVALAWTISVRVLAVVNRSDQVKNAFLATISHEMRTPMNGIIGALNLLWQGPAEREQKTLLQAARSSADAMMVSIDDILRFSEIISGQSVVNPAKVRLGREIEVLLAGFRESARLRGLHYRYHVSSELEGMVRADDQKVLHVVRHLVGNAMKFTEAGEVSVEVIFKPGATSAESRVRVTVADTGPGMDPASMRKLFRPFEQLDGSFSRRHQGMGIGLAICAAMARLLDGVVTLRNRDPHGIEAVFEFPVTLLPENDDVQDGLVAAGDSAVAPATVMVVEDNPVNQLVMKSYLTRLGFAVVTASHGQQALDILQQQTVDLVLMDCQMPVMDGFEATRQIRRLPAPLGQIPIIAVTANIMDVDRAQCLEAGMNMFLKKPVDLDTVRAAAAAFVPLPAR